jgi:hypothetical protein
LSLWPELREGRLFALGGAVVTVEADLDGVERRLVYLFQVRYQVGKDACGVVEPSAAARSFASLDFSLMSYRCTAAEAVAALRG